MDVKEKIDEVHAQVMENFEDVKKTPMMRYLAIAFGAIVVVAVVVTLVV